MDFLLYSYVGIALFLVLTGCGLPIPEEVPIIAAGVASSGDGPNALNPLLAFAACMIGALIGDTIMYSIGRFSGSQLLQRHRWFAAMLNEKTEKRAEQMIKRHGLKVFFLARFLVGVRGPMYIASGILRVPLSRFLITDGICATVVVSTVFGLSWYYGEHFKAAWAWIHESQVTLTIAVISIAAIVGIYIAWHYYRRHKARLASEANEPPSPVTAEADYSP